MKVITATILMLFVSVSFAMTPEQKQKAGKACSIHATQASEVITAARRSGLTLEESLKILDAAAEADERVKNLYDIWVDIFVISYRYNWTSEEVYDNVFYGCYTNTPLT